MLKWVDVPPVWLAGAIGVVWGLDHVVPVPAFGVLAVFGPVLIAVGLILMAVAVAQMLAQRTTVIPKSRPAALVTAGVFGLCRNPIYLGDALILTGVILWWDVPLGFVVLWGFVRVITLRFIRDEEGLLKAGFGAEYDAWAARTGRWLPRG